MFKTIAAQNAPETAATSCISSLKTETWSIFGSPQKNKSFAGSVLKNYISSKQLGMEKNNQPPHASQSVLMICVLLDLQTDRFPPHHVAEMLLSLATLTAGHGSVRSFPQQTDGGRRQWGWFHPGDCWRDCCCPSHPANRGIVHTEEFIRRNF